MMRPLLLGLALLLAGCGTLTSARPLSPGEHVVGVTVGGPLVDAGFAKTPLPMALVQGRSGVALLADRPLDVDYGLNITGLPFGVLALHGGASYLLADQAGARPALAVTERVFFLDNHLDLRKDAALRASHLVSQTELIGSWDTARALLYLGVGQYTDAREPHLLLTPSVGVSAHLGARWALQVEYRHFAINQRRVMANPAWLSLTPTGASGLSLSASRRLGGSP